MRRGGEKDGSVDNWKGVQREEEGDRKKQASKEAGPAECVCGGRNGTGGEREKERTPWLAGWRLAADGERESKGGQGAYKRKGWWRMYCRVVRMCIPIYPLADLLLTPFPSPSTKRNGRRARRQSNDLCTLDRIHRRFTRSNPALHAYVYVSYAGRPGTDR